MALQKLVLAATLNTAINMGGHILKAVRYPRPRAVFEKTDENFEDIEE